MPDEAVVGDRACRPRRLYFAAHHDPNVVTGWQSSPRRLDLLEPLLERIHVHRCRRRIQKQKNALTPFLPRELVQFGPVRGRLCACRKLNEGAGPLGSHEKINATSLSAVLGPHLTADKPRVVPLKQPKQKPVIHELGSLGFCRPSITRFHVDHPFAKLSHVVKPKPTHYRSLLLTEHRVARFRVASDSHERLLLKRWRRCYSVLSTAGSSCTGGRPSRQAVMRLSARGSTGWLPDW